jgi:hypothetical protein
MLLEHQKISDQAYDHLVRIYESRFGKRNVVGAPATEDDVPLPIAMMSLDKIMIDEPKSLDLWMSKNPGPYICMDKINGNPGLYSIEVGQASLELNYIRGGMEPKALIYLGYYPILIYQYYLLMFILKVN